MNLLAIVCWLRRRHAWRKARETKGESAANSYCRTCSLPRAIKRRKSTGIDSQPQKGVTNED